MQTTPNYKLLDYEFGILIQALRKKAGLTQTELAKLVGVSKRAVLNWEAGDSYPQTNRVRRLVEIFLDKGCFTSQEEHTEAEFFWGKATGAKTDVKDAFNVDWFNTLLQERTGSARPLSLYPNLQRQDWSEAVDNRALYGRERELRDLENWIIKDKQRVISLFGMGGIGKTGLAVSLAHQIASHFDYVIFRTLRNAPPLDELLDSILRFLLNGQLTDLPSLQSEKLALIMHYFRQYRCLLILDNLETIMQNGLAAGEYREGYTDYDALIRRLSEFTHKSCLLITSREKPQQLGSREEKNGTVRSLALKGLDKKACLAILNSMNINSSEEHEAILVERYGGNPLALKLIAEPIREIFGGDTGAFLASQGFRYGEIRYILDQHFDRLSKVEQDILYWLTISREPLDVETLQKQSLLQAGIQTISDGLRALFKRFLIEQNEDKDNPGFTLQGVVIDYVTERLITRLHTEIISRTPDMLHFYPVLQTQSREYIRQTQLRVITDPLLAQLQTTLKRPETVTRYLKQLLDSLRNLPQSTQSYAGGNLLNLLIRSGSDLGGWNFENLALWQAHLAGVELHDVNLAGADLTGATFTEAYISAYSLAYSPDGKTLAIGCANGSVKVWQVGEIFGSQLLECQGHTNLVGTVAFSPDGTILASGSMDGTVRLWEPQSGLCLAVLEGPTATVRSVAFSPDGKWLASGGDDHNIYLWQVSNVHLITTIAGDQGWVMSVAFSPDGKLFASGGFDSTIKLWDVSSPQTEVTPVAVLKGHDQWVMTVVFSPDGKLLASGSADQTIRLWSVARQKCEDTLRGHTGIVTAVAFSSDSRLLASGGVEGTISLWNMNNPSAIQKNLPAGSAAITALVFNPDGEIFVSSSAEISNLKLWSVKNLEVLDVLRGYINLIYSIAVSPDGKWLGVGGIDHRLLLWNLTKPLQTAPVVLKGHTGFIVAIAFSPDGKTVASGSSDTTIKLWDLASRKCWRTLNGHKRMVTAAVFSSDNRLLISGDEEGNLKLWSLVTGENLHSQSAHQGRIRKLIFSPDGQTLASGADDGFIRLWKVDAETATIRQIAGWYNQSELVMSLAFNHNGSQLFSGGSDGVIRCWDVVTGECIASINSNNGLLWSIVYNPGGQKLATAGENGFVQLWNVEQPERPELLGSFEQGGKVMAVAFNPAGNILYSGGEGGKIKLWNLENNALVTTLNARSPYEGLNITGVSGLTEAQQFNLLSLGAIETTF